MYIENLILTDSKDVYKRQIRYMDIIDRTMLYMVTGQAEENERIEIDQINIEGYTIHGGQKESFSVSTDGLTVNIYYCLLYTSILKYALRLCSTDMLFPPPLATGKKIIVIL